MKVYLKKQVETQILSVGPAAEPRSGRGVPRHVIVVPFKADCFERGRLIREQRVRVLNCQLA